MRILLLEETDWLKTGPHNHHHLAEKLSLRGHEILMLDFDLLWRTGRGGNKGLCSKRKDFGNVARIYGGAEVTLIRPGIIKLPVLDYVSHIFSSRKEIKRQMEEFAPDVIIGFSILNTYLAAREAKKRNIPFIYYWIDVVHALIPFRPFQVLGKVIERRTLKQGDILGLATNTRLSENLAEMGARETHILRFGIDFEKFALDVDSSIVKSRYGINEGDIVLTFVGFYKGRLAKLCGLRELALTMVKVSDPRLKLMIVGEGTLDVELRQIQEKYALGDRLILTGKRPYEEIPALVKASSVCLLPFLRSELTEDIVPLKIYDYLAMGKPVISVSLPGMIDEFGEDNGIVYVDRPECMFEKAVELVAEGRTVALGAKARRFAEGRSWDIITDELEGILMNEIGKKARTKLAG